jgi:hypothetical protein
MARGIGGGDADGRVRSWFSACLPVRSRAASLLSNASAAVGGSWPPTPMGGRRFSIVRSRSRGMGHRGPASGQTGSSALGLSPLNSSVDASTSYPTRTELPPATTLLVLPCTALPCQGLLAA